MPTGSAALKATSTTPTTTGPFLGWVEQPEPVPIYHVYGANPCAGPAALTTHLGTWSLNRVWFEVLRTLDGQPLPGHSLHSQKCGTCGKTIDFYNWIQQMREKRIPDPDPFRSAMRAAIKRAAKESTP